jgi:uncharacterized membrane protein YfcA
VLATLAVAVGAVVQGISGVGGGFITVPLLAMISLSFLPGPLVIGSISISGLMAWRERKHIDLARIRWILAGTVLGATLGAWLVSGISPDRLGLLFGGMILAGVVITALGLHLPLNRVSATLAGMGAGAMGASSGIGAPVLAVLYQRESGPRVRATLAYIYTLASVLIAIALAVFGRLSINEFGYAALLVPGYMLGYFLSQRVTHHFNQSSTRYIVLGVSAAAALSLIYRSI